MPRNDDIPLIKAVKASTPKPTLRITWDDGQVDRIDMTGPIARLTALAPLEDKAAFLQVSVDASAMGVEWPCGADFSGTGLRDLADAQKPMTPTDFIAWQDRNRLSNKDAAGVIGITTRRVQDYRNGAATIPVSVQTTCKAIDDNPVIALARIGPESSRGRPRKTA